MLSTIRYVWLLSLLSLLSSGCASFLEGNLPRDPNRTLPAKFQGSVDPTTPAVASLAHKTWREFFASPGLHALIELALKNNQELNIQLQETIIARSEVKARRGEIAPKVSAKVGAGVEKVGKYTSQGVSDEAHGVAEHLGDFSFGLSASWEIDIWKKLRNAAKAANLRYMATFEARNFMVTQLVAELSRSYYELIAIDNELVVLHRNIDIQTQALEVVRLQKRAARVTELAVLRFEAEVLKNKSRLFAVEQRKIQTENRINFLVGRFPQPVARNAEEFKAELPRAIAAGLPTEMLENRTDVRRAELELEASKLDVKVAKAAFYPSLSLETGLGYRTFSPSRIVATPESLIYNVLGGLTAPLFNWSGILAQYRSANARQLQAIVAYERTLLQSFIDVTNELANLDNLRESYELQAQQVETLARSVEISGVLFQSARADYMEVLLVRRDSLDAELELIEAKKQRFVSLVNVYQALGGGWR